MRTCHGHGVLPLQLTCWGLQCWDAASGQAARVGCLVAGEVAPVRGAHCGSPCAVAPADTVDLRRLQGQGWQGQQQRRRPRLGLPGRQGQPRWQAQRRLARRRRRGKEHAADARDRRRAAAAQGAPPPRLAPPQAKGRPPQKGAGKSRFAPRGTGALLDCASGAPKWGQRPTAIL